MATLSGVANAGLLAVINLSIDTASYEGLNFRYLLLFVIIFFVFITGKKYALSKSTIIAENIIRGVRERITDKIRQSELYHIEDVGKSVFYTRLTLDTNIISECSVTIINSAQSAIMLVFCLMYIAILSKLAFMIVVSFLIGGAVVYLYSQSSTIGELDEAANKETEFFGLLEHILDGFKEIKINRKKNDHLFTFFRTVAAEAEKLKIKTGLTFVFNIMFSQAAFYIMIGIVVFLMPRLGEAYSDLLVRVTAAILFITGPVDNVVGSIQFIIRSDVAVGHIYQLESELDASMRVYDADSSMPVKEIKSFNQLCFDNVSYSYMDKKGRPLFTIGPANLSVRQGETIFIVGGNGSGKTTFLKVLTGLYYPTSGTMKLNDQQVGIGRVSYPAYREMFSVIFGDFHLFDRLYGLEGIDKDRVNELLELMELDKKTSLADGRFSTIDLSTGQRKRLAMIVALLENKQIYIFDEWAADQDPIFREYYYHILLKRLKDEGKTIIAVSHDDRYFHIADRVMKMEFGQFSEEMSA
ncbi:cyclic peptide export ABC transporter [Desulfococcaceae bacterium HSG8]|nr:cyclic peptide export ABC transporter [Desulfococcaceae bacterium HSG8]